MRIPTLKSPIQISQQMTAQLSMGSASTIDTFAKGHVSMKVGPRSLRYPTNRNGINGN